MAMIYSIETRIPFLDYKLVEYMAGIDKSVKMDFLQRKSVLINTFKFKLPVSVFKGAKKRI